MTCEAASDSGAARPAGFSAQTSIIGGQGVYVRLAQTAFSFDAATNQLSSTVSLTNLSGVPWGLDDNGNYDGLGPQVFFARGPTNTGGTPGVVTILNADPPAAFTGTNQPYFRYAEVIPQNATNLTPKTWIFQLPGPTTTFSFQVWVETSWPLPYVSISERRRGPSTSLLASTRFSHVAESRGTGNCVAMPAYCWGSNASGELGEGTTMPRSFPIGVLGLGVAAISIGHGAAHGCLTWYEDFGDRGWPQCWGSNRYGQLGITANAGTNVPNPVPSAVPVRSFDPLEIATGAYHSCAFPLELYLPTIWCWGLNDFGQLGTATNAGSMAPNPTPSLVSFATAPEHCSYDCVGTYRLSAGDRHTCLATAGAANGTIWCWGSNQSGQLGVATNSGTTTPTTTAQQVPTIARSSGYDGVSAGGAHTCSRAILALRVVYCWGSNQFGQLGVALNSGTTTATPTPQPVAGLPAVSFTAVSAGATHTCAVSASNRVYCWGSNEFGQLGVSLNTGTTTPTPAPQLVPLPAGVAGFQAVSAGLNTTCALTTATTTTSAGYGTVYCWGDNRFGQLGRGSIGGFSSTPVALYMPS